MTGPLSPWAFIPKGGYTGFPHNVATPVPEHQHLLIRPHFLKLEAKLIFIVEASPRVWIERGGWAIIVTVIIIIYFAHLLIAF